MESGNVTYTFGEVLPPVELPETVTVELNVPSLFDLTRTPIRDVPQDESKPIKSKITPREKSRFDRPTFVFFERLRNVFIFT